MKKRLIAFLALLSVVVMIPLEALAMGDLTITPWRVVFGPRGRSASIELLNTSDNTNTYRVGWMLLKPNAEGKYEQIPYDKEKDKDPHSVPNMVIYSPRQVTIEPHGSQVIRLSLRRPADLPSGEYRAHVTFIKMAREEDAAHDPNAKSMELKMNVNLGFSIPVIVRQGEDKDLKISLSNPELKMQGKTPALKININRDAGTFSSYGTMEVYLKSKGEEKKIGEMNNVALYSELRSRFVIVPLTTKDTLTSGELHVVYKGKLDAEGTTWAEKTFPIGG